VRKFLIAYNVNLNTTITKIAKEIGWEIREKGRAIKDKNGKQVKDENGNIVRKPGLLKNTQAAGWFIDEYNRAQVTINIMDHIETPLHVVYETVKEQAEKLGARVTGSELVGLIPKEAMLMAGRYYLDKQGTSRAFSEKEIIRIAALSMGLDELTPFDIDQKIIEYHFVEDGLKDMKVNAFADELASDSPAPGGGSVAALLGSMAASLSCMVSNLTYYKKKYEKSKEMMGEVGEQAQLLKQRLLNAIDEDTEAFNRMAAAGRLPKNTDEEKVLRDEAMEEANKYAMQVPFTTMNDSLQVLRLAKKVAENGNPNCLSDAGVANLCGYAAIMGAYYNVKINAPSVEDKDFTNNMLKDCEKIISEAQKIYDEIRGYVEGKL
ncbi:glutamate formimidoyltransferase, partial [Candidatus Woesearchaeota archaeon]